MNIKSSLVVFYMVMQMLPGTSITTTGPGHMGDSIKIEVRYSSLPNLFEIVRAKPPKIIFQVIPWIRIYKQIKLI